MKMRNWLKTTLAAGLVAATGAAMVGCGCDEAITYKAGMEAYRSVITAENAATEDFLKAGKDGFTLNYSLSEDVFKADGTKEKTKTTKVDIITITGENGLSQVTKTTKDGSEAEKKEVVNYAKTKIGEAADATAAYAFYNADKKQITQEGNYEVINLAQAYQINILNGIFYSALGDDFGLVDDITDLDKSDDYKDVEDIVKKFNEDNNKEAKLENTKKVMKADFFKTGENAYRLTLGIEVTTWTGEATALKANVENQEVTFEIKDKAITKINATSTAKADGKQTKNKVFEVKIDYQKPSLTAADKITATTPETAITSTVIAEQFKEAA